MRPHSAPALALLLLLTACTAPGPRPDASGVLTLEGPATKVANDCHFDGVCTVTVDGVVVTTMSGERLNTPVWGHSDGQPRAGQRVQVRCLATAPGHCTLRGDAGYFLRHRD